GYDVAQLPRVRMPDTRVGVLFKLAQFSVRDKSLVLLTQGLGEQPFHGHMAVLVNEKTSSAGEMAAQFAKDTKLATLIGQKTAGLVLDVPVDIDPVCLAEGKDTQLNKALEMLQ